MNDLFETSNRVVWREGALLAPQHLQQQERHLRSQIQLRFGASRPYPWGILNLELAVGAIQQGEFQLDKLKAILPDGLYIDCGGKDPLPASRTVANSFHSIDNQIIVYIGVPLEKPGMPSFDEDPEEQGQEERMVRFCVRSEEIFDQTQEREGSQVQTASPRCKLLLGDESRDDYVSIPIARVVRSGAGFAIDPSFIPPCLNIAASPFFKQRVNTLLGTCRERLFQLQAHRRERGAAGFEMRERDTAIYMWLFALGARIPVIETVLKNLDASPHTLFQELYATAGQLAVLVPKYDNPPSADYDHLNLQGTFEPLLATLHDLLTFSFQQSYRTLKLKGREDGMWLAEVKDDLLSLKGEYVLAVSCIDLTADIVSARLPDLAKLASYAEVSGLVHSALRGVPLQPLLRAPETIPHHSNTVYFKIDRGADHWQRIVQDKNIALYIGEPFNTKNIAVQLMVGLHEARESIVPGEKSSGR